MAEEYCALYRFYDETGALLYVGISSDPGRRFAQHRSDKPWWHAITEIRVQPMPSRMAALAAEAAAIKDERPQYNVIHNAGSVTTIRDGETSVYADLRWLAEIAAYRAIGRIVHELGGSFDDDQQACSLMTKVWEAATEAYMMARRAGEDGMAAGIKAAAEMLPVHGVEVPVEEVSC